MIKLKYSHLSCIVAFVLSIAHEIPSCIHNLHYFKKKLFRRTGFIGFIVNMDSVIGASLDLLNADIYPLEYVLTYKMSTRSSGAIFQCSS